MCGPTVGQRVLYCVSLALLSQCWASVIQPQRDTTSAAAAPQLGQQVKERIHNGLLAEPTDFPSVVHLSILSFFPVLTKENENYNGTGGGCTGSIISDRWVLTAAHCLTYPFFYDKLNNARDKRFDGVKLVGDIKAGTANLLQPSLYGRQIRSIEECIPHPDAVKYKGVDDVTDFDFLVDIALCKIKGKFDFTTSYVQPMPIISGDIPEERQCQKWTVVGFGAQCFNVTNNAVSLKDGNLYSFNIRAGRSLSDCNGIENAICFDQSNTQSTAGPGDSGGPLICENGKNQQVIIGTLTGPRSFVTDIQDIQYLRNSTCINSQGQWKYSRYAQVSYFTSWIDEVTANEPDKPTFKRAQDIGVNTLN